MTNKPKNPAQKTLFGALGKAPPLPKPGFVADGAAASVHATAVDMAKKVVVAAAAGKSAPPRAAVPGFINDNDKPEECERVDPAAGHEEGGRGVLSGTTSAGILARSGQGHQRAHSTPAVRRTRVRLRAEVGAIHNVRGF